MDPLLFTAVVSSTTAIIVTSVLVIRNLIARKVRSDRIKAAYKRANNRRLYRELTGSYVPHQEDNQESFSYDTNEIDDRYDGRGDLTGQQKQIIEKLLQEGKLSIN